MARIVYKISAGEILFYCTESLSAQVQGAHFRLPIDCAVFDGLADGTDVTVTFAECKTGKSQMDANEKAVLDAIGNKLAKWGIIRTGGWQRPPSFLISILIDATPSQR
ncbi:MAG: hypothetical protein OXP12_02765 [Thaumarchaeota archaeon]|nr:hypothetical protein [Nitrososphaerota archaeon]